MRENRTPVTERELDEELAELFVALQGPPDPRARPRSHRRRWRIPAVAVVCIGAVSAVGMLAFHGSDPRRPAENAQRADSEAVCFATIEFGGRQYYGNANAGPLSTGSLLGRGTIPSCRDSATTYSDGSLTSNEDDIPSVAVDVYAIKGVSTAVAVFVPLDEHNLGGLYVASNRCIGIEARDCLYRSLRFEGRAYTPSRDPRLSIEAGSALGNGELASGDMNRSVLVLKLKGVPATHAVMVSNLPDEIFIAEGVCDRGLGTEKLKFPACLE